MFEGRLPAALQERAPKVVVTEQGHEVWEFEGERHFQVGQNAVAGRRPETVKIEPFRFDQMRPGCYDPDARVRDMDTGGIWASLNFPSMITGFCGRVLLTGQGPRPRIRRHAGVERLDVRGVVGRASRALHPARDHRPRRRRARCGGDPAQRRSRLHLDLAPRATPSHRVPVDLRRPLGAHHPRLRGDRHRDQPARGFVRHGRLPGRLSAVAAGSDAVRPAVADRVCRVGVVRVGRESTPS